MQCYNTGVEFKYRPVKILSAGLAEISDIRVLRDNDHIYAVDEDELHRLLALHD